VFKKKHKLFFFSLKKRERVKAPQKMQKVYKEERVGNGKMIKYTCGRRKMEKRGKKIILFSFPVCYFMILIYTSFFFFCLFLKMLNKNHAIKYERE
jgi:hypothetical protein